MYFGTVLNVAEFSRQLHCFITGLPTCILWEQSFQFFVTLIFSSDKRPEISISNVNVTAVLK